MQWKCPNRQRRTFGEHAVPACCGCAADPITVQAKIQCCTMGAVQFLLHGFFSNRYRIQSGSSILIGAMSSSKIQTMLGERAAPAVCVFAASAADAVRAQTKKSGDQRVIGIV